MQQHTKYLFNKLFQFINDILTSHGYKDVQNPSGNPFHQPKNLMHEFGFDCYNIIYKNDKGKIIEIYIKTRFLPIAGEVYQLTVIFYHKPSKHNFIRGEQHRFDRMDYFFQFSVTQHRLIYSPEALQIFRQI